MSSHTLHLLVLAALALIDCVECLSCAPEVPATSLLEGLDDAAAALLDAANIALAHREILPLNEAVFFEVASTRLESDELVA